MENKPFKTPPRTYISDSSGRRAAPVPNPRARNDPEHLARVEALRRKRGEMGPPRKAVPTSNVDDNLPILQTVANVAPPPPIVRSSSPKPPVRTKSPKPPGPIAAPRPVRHHQKRPTNVNTPKEPVSRDPSISPSTIYSSYSDERVDLPKSTPNLGSKQPLIYNDPKSKSSTNVSSPKIHRANPEPPVEKPKQKIPFVPVSEKYRNRLLDALIELSETEPTEPKREDFLTEEGYYSWLDRIENKNDDSRFEILLAEMVRRWDINYPLLSDEHIVAERKRVEQQAKAAAATPFKTSLNLILRILEARNLIKDPKDRARNCFAVVQYPNANGEMMRYETKAIPNSLNPVWDQEVTLTVTNLSEKILITVYNLREKSNLFGDDIKEEFMGSFTIDVQSIVSQTVKSGFTSNWFELKSEIADKDKNVGKNVEGQVNVEFEISGLVNEDNSEDSAKELPPELRQLKAIQHLLISNKVNLKSLYAVLVKACVLMDLCVPPGTNFYEIDVDKLEWTLSKESDMILAEFARIWTIGDMYKKMRILDCVFERYQQQRIHARALLVSYRIIYEKVFLKGSIWLPHYEQPILFDLFAKIESHVTDQIKNYKAFFPVPAKLTKFAILHITTSLRSILLLTRFIDKNPFFLENYNEQQDDGKVKIGITDMDYKNGKFSFTEKLNGIIQSKMVSNYQHLSELATPMDGAETAPGIVYKCCELARMIITEIEHDRKVYREAFIEEMDILPLSVKAYVPNLLLEVQNMARLVKKSIKTRSTLFNETTNESTSIPVTPRPAATSPVSSDDGIPQTEEEMIGMAFELMQYLKTMQKKIESFKLENVNLDFEIVTAFSPFIFRWLELTEERTVEWAENAINLDEFRPSGDEFSSSSVTDLYAAIFSALEFLQKTLAGWESNESHYALFVTRFSQIAFRAIKHYCDRMESMPNKFKDEMQTNRQERKNSQQDVATTVSNVWNWVTGVQQQQQQQPKQAKPVQEDLSDPAMEKYHKHLCVRLSNLEQLAKRLRSLYKSMNGAQMVDATERWRKRKNTGKSSSTVNTDSISGIIRLRVVCAENLKSKGAFGKTFPYVLIKRPYETGNANLKVEVARSRAAAGLNPVWTYLNPSMTKTTRRKPFPFLKEPAQYIVPVVDATELDVAVYHKLEQTGTFAFMQGSEDTLLGSGTLKLSKSEILSSKNNSLVWVDIQPQGRVLLNLEFVSEGLPGLTRSTGDDGISFGLAGSEDIDYWFLKMEACIDSARYKIVRQIVDDLHVVIAQQFGKIVNEAALNLQSSQEDYVSIEMADLALANLAGYLNKNLGIFSACLPSILTQYVIYNIWRRNILYPIMQYLNPIPFHADSILQTGLFSQQKVLDARQKNMLKQCLTLLTHFFHAEGDPLGIPMSMLKDCGGFNPGEPAKNASLTRQFFE